MGAVSGDINTLSTFCVDPADLSSRPVASMKSGDRAYVRSLEAAATGARFFLDQNSVEVVNNVTVINALGGVGRWLSEVAFPGVPSPLVIDAIVAKSIEIPASAGVGGAMLTYQKSFPTPTNVPQSIDAFTPDVNSVYDVIATVVGRSTDGLNFFKQDVEASFAVDGAGVITQIGANTTTAAKLTGPSTPGTLAIALNPVGPVAGLITLDITGNALEAWYWTANITRIWYAA